jgi:adenosyl cobinamide kinase/adenosyl cobinamide phosphate guanylyltransferase
VLHLVFGAPQSGKSIFAENIAALYSGSTIYIGTLPGRRRYKELIAEHQNRRPPVWSLIELICDPLVDLPALRQALSDYRNVLLDGLTFYILRLMALKASDWGMLRREMVELIESAAHKEGHVVVVDSLTSTILEPIEKLVVRAAHDILARKAHTIRLYECGTARPISFGELLRIDRLSLTSGEDWRIIEMRDNA